MAFNQLVIVTIGSAITGFITTISLAYIGFGPNSMAIGAVVGNIATGVGAWTARTDRNILLPSFSEWRALLNFGGQSALTNIITTIAMDINDLALGKILGFTPVAIISRAQGLMNLFHRDIMTAIRGVAFPAFAKAYREGESLETRYIASVAAVTVIAWPFYGFTAFYALELLRLMFGPQWDKAAILVPIFCLAGAFLATSSLISSAIIAVGRIDLVTKSELLFQPLRAMLIIAAAMIFKSLFACAIAFLIAFILYTPYAYIFKEHCIKNNYKDLLSNLWVSAKVTISALTLPAILAIHTGLDRSTPMSLSLLISAAMCCGVIWLVALVVFKHPVTNDPLFKRITCKLPCFA